MMKRPWKKEKKKTFNPESVIFGRPVARQTSGNYTLRMIMKVAYLKQNQIYKRFSRKQHLSIGTSKDGLPGLYNSNLVLN